MMSSKLLKYSYNIIRTPTKCSLYVHSWWTLISSELPIVGDAWIEMEALGYPKLEAADSVNDLNSDFLKKI